MDILVVGAGSLGSLLGGLLASDHDVTLVGRDPHVTAITTEGLTITGEYERTVRPRAVTDVADMASVDLALVTVKAYDTEAAAEALAHCDVDAALSLQNGMGNEECLATALECPVLAGTTTFGARLVEPGVVACTGVGDITLGPHDDASIDVATRVGEAFRAADLETTVVEDMRPHLWRKLAVNAGVNPVTALARVDNGALATDPAKTVAEAAAMEVARVARVHGVELSDEMAREALATVVETTTANVSSMRADVESGRRTEVDAINGYVVEHAVGAVPVNHTLTALIRSWERARLGD